MDWAAAGQVASGIVALLAFGYTYVKTRKSEVKKEVAEQVKKQVDLKIMGVTNELNLVKQGFTSLKELVNLKLDNIERIAKRTENLFLDHLTNK